MERTSIRWLINPEIRAANRSFVATRLLTTPFIDHTPCFHTHPAVYSMYTLTRRAPSLLLLPLPHAPVFPHASGVLLPSNVLFSFSFALCQPFDWFYDFCYAIMTGYCAISFMCDPINSVRLDTRVSSLNLELDSAFKALQSINLVQLV